jgi:gliding motility-associated-like protein
MRNELYKHVICIDVKNHFHTLVVVGLLAISSTVSAQDHYNFNYTDRNSLVQDGWDFIAVTPQGDPRNTELTTGAIISYDQQSHPGVIRIPVDDGNLLASSNNSHNTIFRDIPDRWTSIRVKISSFSPNQNYQQAGLAVYQDDDNYLQLTRRYDGNNCIKYVKETSGSGINVNTINSSSTSNLYLRIDRDPSTEIITAYYSLDGSIWYYIANTTFILNNPRLAITTGGSTGSYPNADFSWAEVYYQTPVSGDELLAQPHEIVFNTVQGTSLSATRSIFLSSSKDGILNWNLTTDASWLIPDSYSGETDKVIKVRVNTTGLQSGIYQGNIYIDAPQSASDPLNIIVKLIINPDVPVKVTTWENGRAAAMSVSVDDSQPSGFDELQACGFKGTYVLQGDTPPSFYTTYFNAGMELGSHLVHHLCETLINDVLKYQEIEPNISGLCTHTPQPCKDVITLVWPCGYTNYREEAIASDYYLSSRGYFINSMEDQTPDNFMNLKCYNSHEHPPFPPSDFKTLVDLAVAQKKWYNLVLHDYSNDDDAITYASTKDIWVASIGTVVKYILQRERFILTDYSTGHNKITFKASRLPVPSTEYRSFEDAFGPNDKSTIQIDIDDNLTVENVYVEGAENSYSIRSINGNSILFTDVRLSPESDKTVEVRYVNTGINLTVTGVTASNKVYNGTTSAVINTVNAVLVGVLDDNDVTLVSTGATGAFTNKNVGTNKTVVTTGFTLTGADAEDYTLTQPTATANITAIGLSITGAIANNKVYDHTTAATLNTGNAVLAGVISGDLVTLNKTAASGTFNNKNVGTSKPVTVSGFTLSGTDAGNYTLTQPSLTANITPASLYITGVTANDKVYDGTVTATINTVNALLSGILSGDAVTLITSGASGYFENASAGTSKTVFTSGFSITGTDAGNYNLTLPTTTASIIGLPLTITGVTANNKVYNGNTSATLNTGSAVLQGVIAGDAVTLVKTGATGNFINKNVGQSKTVTTSGFTLSGADADKYSLTQPSATATITHAELTISGVRANDKVYNGSITAVINSGNAALSGLASGDNVSLVTSGAGGTFNDKNIGTSKTVTTAGFTITGTDSGNYTLNQPVTTANITPATLNISGVTADDKVYNASTDAVVHINGSYLTGVIGSESVTLGTAGVSGTFTDKNAGSDKTVVTNGFSISGADAFNYYLIQPSPEADIIPAGITVTGVEANNKIYDGTTTASLDGSNASLTGVISGDAVSLIFTGASGTFADKNIGISKTVTTTGIRLGGTDAGNYNITQPVTSADITIAPLTVTGVAANYKSYDGTVQATLNTIRARLSVVFSSDVVILNSTNAYGSFSDKNVGTNKNVHVSGFEINGPDAFNYALSQPSLTASILPRIIKVKANDLHKPYQTELIFNGDEYSYEGLIPGDNLPSFVLSSPGAGESSLPGDYVISISGGSLPNYIITYINGILTVEKNILVVRADNKTKIYGSENPVLSITYSGFVNGDDVSVIDDLPEISTTAQENSDPGIYPITLSGGSDEIYTLRLENGRLDVQKAPLIISADNKSKIWGEVNPDLTVTYSGFIAGQDESVLDVQPIIESIVDVNSDAGEYEITVSGAVAHNYDISFQNGIFTVEKVDQTINFDRISEPVRMTQQINLDAFSTSGLPVTFILSDPEKASLKGDLLTLNNDGTLVITAVQEGDPNHNPAKEISQKLDILPTFDNISSLFTPNADGMNDYWHIPNLEEYGEMHVIVYNRFGQIVYESQSYKNDWDGTWNGHPLPSASYYYIIKSSLKGFFKGVVNIVR